MTHIPSPFAPLLPIVTGAAALATALAAQVVGELVPCALCIWQRWPYVAAVLLGFAAVALRRLPAAQRAAVTLAGLAILVSATIAAFHVGVEQHWWQGTAACGSRIDGGSLSVEQLTAQLLATPVARCDEVPWSLAGISMAGFNFLYATIAGLATVWLARRTGSATASAASGSAHV